MRPVSPSIVDLLLNGPRHRPGDDFPIASADYDAAMDREIEFPPDPHGEAVRAAEMAAFRSDLERRIREHHARVVATMGERQGQRGKRHPVVCLSERHGEGFRWFRSMVDAVAHLRTLGVQRAVDNLAQSIRREGSCGGRYWMFADRLGPGRVVILDGARWFVPESGGIAATSARG